MYPVDNTIVSLYYCITMTWITTNIRLPKDVYMAYKMQAARQRKSVAAVMREKLAPEKKRSKQSINALMKEFDRVAKVIAKQNKGISLSKALIEARYE